MDRSKRQAYQDRICVLGNSFVGALQRAYTTSTPEQGLSSYGFFASAWPEYLDLDVADGVIVKAAVSNRCSARVADYDACVVYGDLPGPDEAAAMWDSLPSRRYSEQVRAAALRCWAEGRHALRLARRLTDAGATRIALVSRNPDLTQSAGARETRSRGASLIEAAIAPFVYVPHPDELFDANGFPKAEFYKDSLNVAGEQPDRALQPAHHHTHLNAPGGKLLLTAVQRRLAETADRDHMPGLKQMSGPKDFAGPTRMAGRR